jgi:hypothetical protein
LFEEICKETIEGRKLMRQNMKTKMTKIVALTLILQGCYLSFGKLPVKAEFSWMTRVTQYVQHTVESGDTLEQLASLYGSSKTKIIAQNQLQEGQVLVEGQKIMIPVMAYKEKLII